MILASPRDLPPIHDADIWDELSAVDLFESLQALGARETSRSPNADTGADLDQE